MDQPTPDHFIDAAFGYLKTAAIQAAVGLDLFTAIAQEGGDLDRVAARTGASKRGVCTVRLSNGPGGFWSAFAEDPPLSQAALSRSSLFAAVFRTEKTSCYDALL